MDREEILIWKQAANDAGFKNLWTWIVYVIRREVRRQQRAKS